jgi:nucleotide-binding universal stress UspA family protein
MGLKRILLATEFSQNCENALDFVIDLVKHKPIKVDIMHVFDIPVNDSSYIPYAAVQGIIDVKKETAERLLKERMEKIDPANQGDIYAVLGVFPSTDIAEQAKIIGSDLIAMGLAQKYGMMEKMIGSVTAHTIEKASVPVLAIPATARFTEFDDILFPTQMDSYLELTDPEKKALEWLYDFSILFGGPKVHLLHIAHGDSRDEIDFNFDNSPFKEMDFTISTSENVHEGILLKLLEVESELIAMYKPHRKFWEGLFHNSQTKKLLYESPIPLLIFH